jgi:hypothetical protein
MAFAPKTLGEMEDGTWFCRRGGRMFVRLMHVSGDKILCATPEGATSFAISSTFVYPFPEAPTLTKLGDVPRGAHFHFPYELAIYAEKDVPTYMRVGRLSTSDTLVDVVNVYDGQLAEPMGPDAYVVMKDIEQFDPPIPVQE